MKGVDTMTQSATLNLRDVPFHLGEPVKVYRQNLNSQLLFPVRLVVWAALVLLVCALVFLFLDGTDWDVASDVSSALLVLVTMLGFIGMVTFISAKKLGQLLIGWRDIAVEYADGVAYFHLGTWRDLRWNEISEVGCRERSNRWSDWTSSGDIGDLVFVPLLMFLVGHMRDYSICGERTGPIRICGTLKDAPELMETIQTRTFSNRKKRAVTALQGGAEVSFGKTAVHISHGVRKGGKWHAWDEISAVDTSITIKPVSGLIRLTTKVSTDQLPNGDILLSIVLSRKEWQQPDP
jgi:hypothetical protein